DVIVAIPDGRGADRLKIRSAIRLGERKAAAQLTSRETRQELLALLRRAHLSNDIRHDEVRVDDAAERHPHARNPFNDLGVRRRAEAEAAVLSRDDRAEKPELLHPLDDLFRIYVLVLEPHHVWAHVAIEETIDAFENNPFVLCDFVGVLRVWSAHSGFLEYDFSLFERSAGDRGCEFAEIPRIGEAQHGVLGALCHRWAHRHRRICTIFLDDLRLA